MAGGSASSWTRSRNEMERLIKKPSMACCSHLDLEKDKEKEKQLVIVFPCISRFRF